MTTLDEAIRAVECREFDENSLKKEVHEFAMRPLSEVQRKIFEQLKNPADVSEIFETEIAAGNGYFAGYMACRAQDQADKAKLAAALRIAVETLDQLLQQHYIIGNPARRTREVLDQIKRALKRGEGGE